MRETKSVKFVYLCVKWMYTTGTRGVFRSANARDDNCFIVSFHVIFCSPNKYCACHTAAVLKLCESCTHCIEHPLVFLRERYTGSFVCKVDKLVMEFVEEARKAPLPVTRATIQSFRVADRDKLLAAASTAADDKKKLELFGGSEKWVCSFLLRHGMSSTVLHREAGSVDIESIAEGMEAIRSACQDYDMENIFNVDDADIFFRLLPKRTYLSRAENRKTAMGRKAMKAKDRVPAYMCTNATGTGTVPIAIIGKFKGPRCFRATPCPIRYLARANA